MALSLNGDELCKEIDSVIPDDLDLMRRKAICYCLFLIYDKNIGNKELKEKCEKYLEHHKFYRNLKK